MSKKLENKNLFNASSLNLPAELTTLFQQTTYPWEILSLIKKTVTKMVSNVPAEQRLKGNISEGAVLNGDMIVVEEGATVEALSYIDGPTYIAKGATIRHGAYIRGGVYIGEGCIAGHTTEIKDSLLLLNSKAAHFAYLGNSILGANVNLGAGTKLANLRLDHCDIRVKFEGNVYDTKQKKFGAIFANGAQSGCNSVTNPGTILLNNSALLPTKAASGVIENNLGLVKRK